MVGSFLGLPWRRGAVLMRFSEVIGELVAIGIDVDGGSESFYENDLIYAPFNSVIFGS